MSRFVIPTVFTAVDQMTAPVLRMQSAVNNLALISTRAERSFNNFLPNIDSAVKNRINFMVSMGKAMAVIGVALLTVNSLVEYEKELANLKALTGATGREFQRFKDIIQSVARESKTSAVDVAKGFTAVANAMPELLQSAEGLGQVTSASVLLSKAARMELAPAAEAVTTILNQFGLGARDAAKLVDLMAAGSTYGSAEIEDLSLTMREFGASARLANVSVRESVALTELVSRFRKGTQAGIELRNVMLYLDTLKVQDPKALTDLHRLGVNMDTVSNKSLPLADRLMELKKIAGDDAALFHVFGKENLAMAATVLQNADNLQSLNAKLGETGLAAKMADANMSSLYGSLVELKAAWVNIVTGLSGANWGMRTLAGTARFLGRNLDTLVNLALIIVTPLALWKAGLLAVSLATKVATAAMVGYNVAAGLTAGLLGRNTALLYGSEVAFYAYAAGAYAANAATTIFGNTLKGVLATVSVITAGLFLIWQYRKEIQNWANDTTLGRQYNALIGDKEAVQQSLERMYINDPVAARNWIHKPIKTIQDQIQGLNMDSVFNRIDQGLPLGDANDIIIQNKKFENSSAAAISDTNVHVYVNVDKQGQVSVNGKNATGAVPVTVKRSGYDQ